jgi:SIR2-like domain
MNSISERLAAIIAREDTVIFIGSGVSAWSGLPTWRDLLQSLAGFLSNNNRSPELVKREIANNDFLLAASYGFDQLTQHERCEFLRESLRMPSATPSPLHEAIARLQNNCYITTNYDNLFEATLRQFRPDRIFEVVTPLQQFEVSSIVQSRAEGFLFKPHGDLGSCDSIVITREDYRSLLSERRNVFEATRTLLASRPVVYIGFGLRDPDFLLTQDLLNATFGINPSDHYAIMPDLSPEETTYWRKHYGIHLITYLTDQTQAGPSKHRALLDMLSEISAHIAGRSPKRTNELARTDPTFSSDSTRILAYARHARRLRSTIEQANDVMPLTLEYIRRPGSGLRRSQVFRADALRLLTETEERLIIQGPPGSGKSFILQQAVLILAQSLEHSCLTEDTPDIANLRVPVVVDMRDYRNDLTSMLTQALPFDLPLEDLLNAGIGAFFLDGINEAPVDSLESKTLVADIVKFLEKAERCQVVLTTRFSSEIADLDLPVYLLDEISIDYIHQEINQEFRSGTLSDATIELLRRPLFHRAWKDGQIDLEHVYAVHDIYSQLIGHLECQAAQQFGSQVGFSEIFERIAYSMIDFGQLSMAAAEVYSNLRSTLPTGIKAYDFVNYAISTGTLIATPGKRLAFFHHSVTEYFAAHYLAKLIEMDRGAVQRCLGRRDWDQALLLTLGFVASEVAEQMFAEILGADRLMALRALSYIEAQRSKWTGMALQSLAEFPPSDFEEFRLGGPLLRLEYDESHIPALTIIAARNTSLAGTAVGILSSISEEYQDSALDMLLELGREYNFLSSLSEALAPQISTAKALELLDRAKDVPLSSDAATDMLRGEEIYEYLCIISACGNMLRRVPTSQVLAKVQGNESVLVELIVCDSVDHDRTPEALQFSQQCIVRGHEHAISTLYLQLSFGEPVGSVTPEPEPGAVDALLAALRDGRSAQWALDVLKALCDSVPAVLERIRSVTGERLLVSALLAYSVGNHDKFFELLREGLRDGVSLWLDPAVEGLGALEVSWHGQEDLMLSLLATRRAELAEPLLDSLIHRAGSNDDLPINCSIDDLGPWVEWLGEVRDPLLADRLGNFLATGTDSSTRERIIQMFNRVTGSRRVLSDYVLDEVPGLSTSDLSPDGVEWLIGQLNARSYSDGTHEPLIARIATEELVQERLLPLYLESSAEQLRKNLKLALLRLGRSHRRRYIGDNGQVLG